MGRKEWGRKGKDIILPLDEILDIPPLIVMCN